MGQQRQDGVPVPAGPATDLVVVQANLTFGVLEAVLNRPAHTGDPYQGSQRGAGRAGASVEGQCA